MVQNKSPNSNDKVEIRPVFGYSTQKNENSGNPCDKNTNSFKPENMDVQCIYGPPVPPKRDTIGFYCKSCGAAADDFAIYCKVCGSKLVTTCEKDSNTFSPDNMEIQTVYSPPLPPPPKNRIAEFFSFLRYKLKQKK